MLPTVNTGTGPMDLNTIRVVEQIALVLNDVEHKIQMLKMSIQPPAASWPSPAGVSSFGGAAFPTYFPYAAASPIASLLTHPVVQQQLLSNPVVQQHLFALSTALQGPSTFPGAYPNPSTPYAGVPGVSAPFGVSPFQAQVPPFRL